MSSGSIISTASSNSHKRGGERKSKHKDQTNTLQVAGMKLGSNRKGYIPSKYEKSPFINLGGPPAKHHSDFLSANAISMSTGSENVKNRANGVDNGPVSLSIAVRKKEL